MERFERYSPQQRRQLLLLAYYEQLNADSSFRESLGELFLKLSRDCPELADSAAEVTSLLPSFTVRQLERYRALASMPGDPFGIGEHYRLLDRLSGLRALLGALSDRWHLPASAEADLIWSYCWYQSGKRPPNITPQPVGEWLPVGDWLTVPQPSPLFYNPHVHSREWLNERIDEVCRELRSNLLQQAEAAEEDAQSSGFGVPPTRMRHYGHAARIARRLYLRCVKSWSWQRIANSEGAESRVVDRSNIRKSVERLASELGISLSRECGE